MRKILFVLALATALLAPVAASAQTAPIEHRFVSYSIQSGQLGNLDESVESVVYQEVIDGGDVPWMRVVFNNTVLQGNSYLRLTSLFDGATQRLDTTALSEWRDSSAYFNGSRVRIELIAAPGTWRNHLGINQLIVGEWTGPISESQCGPTDDRVRSDEPERGRLVSIGCSASIITEGSCFLTAGHCISPGGLGTMEFNVPESLPSGTIQHPGPEDQYPVEELLAEEQGQVGVDWALFTTFDNSETGLSPFEAQGASLTLATSVPNIDEEITIVGYGVDSGVDNQVQQISFGPVVDNGGTSLGYVADTTGGNSGSSVTHSATAEVVAVHTHGGCNVDGTGNNWGTQITKPALQDALPLCPVGSTFILSPPTPSLPGETNTWAFVGANPSAEVWVIRGRTEGTSSIPGCPGANLSIANARPIDNTTADGNGDGAVVKDAPNQAGGTYLFQAIDMSDCSVSNRVSSTF